MILFDNILLPTGLIFCGLLASAPLWLRYTPFLRGIIYSLLPIRIILGVSTGFSGFVALLFPAHGPAIFGSFFPAVTGIIAGILHSLELFAQKKVLSSNKLLMIWIGNVMIYLKYVIGIAALVLGIYHLFKPATLFF